MRVQKRWFCSPYFWGTLATLAAGLMIVGWARTYPVSSSPAVIPILSVVSPLFWIGLVLGFLGIAGLSVTSRSSLVMLILCCAFVLLLTSPQLLYVSWGSDAGAAVGFVNHIQMMSDFDIAAEPYFQWPLSIFFQRFLLDLFRADEYTAVQLGLVSVCICVGGGLFALWRKPIVDNRSETADAVFWGVVVYFVGFFWLFNWQAVPYAFSLALFFPMLAVLYKQSLEHKVLGLLLFGVGIEAHALFGVWAILIVILLFVGQWVLGWIHRKTSDHGIANCLRSPPIGPNLHNWGQITQKGQFFSLAVLLIVVQISMIVLKNEQFLNYTTRSLQGYYQSLLNVSASHTSVAFAANRALSYFPQDPVSAVLKALSWLGLAAVGVAFSVATVSVLVKRRFGIGEFALLGAGIVHFIFGTQYAAIGNRSVQLIGIVPALFVVDSIAQRNRSGRIVLVACFISLLLFPAAIIRSHQNSGNFVRPVNIAAEDFLGRQRESLQRITIINEGRITPPRDFDCWVMTPISVWLNGCGGRHMIVDTAQFRSYVRSVALRRKTQNDIETHLGNLSSAMSTIYDNGSVALRVGEECKDLDWLWK